MSKTPRTDEAETQFWVNATTQGLKGLTTKAVHSDFARQLELETIEYRKALNVVCEDRDYLYGQVMKLSPKTDENNQTTN